MSFALQETSTDSGKPVELVLFSYLTNKWAYTTCEKSIVHDGVTYIPMPVSRSSVNNTGDVSKASVTVNVPEDCPVGELFRVQPPSGVVVITIFQKHFDDPEAKVVWKGRIVNAEWEQPWLKLTTESVFSSLQRLGLRRKFGTQCQIPIYSIGIGLCNVIKENYEHNVVVSTISGVTIVCPALYGSSVNYFGGGFITWIDAERGYLDRQMISESAADGTITLVAPPRNLLPGMSIKAYPGCDHTLQMCIDKFDNALNHGGMPYIPKKNPFGGSTLY